MTMMLDERDTQMMQGREDGDIIAVSSGTLATQHRAEIDMQISTAKKYPRSIHKAIQSAITMATIDPETAGSCFYKVPRSRKTIEGPSVRLAEIICSAWGNMRFAARVVSEDDRFIIAQGTAHDLETNNATMIEVRRRITDKNGRKFDDDMVGVTGNAACSIALRNAVFRVVPRSYVDQVWKQAKRVAIGDVKTLSERRTALVGHITGKIGIPISRVLAVVSRAHEDDIDLNDLETLYGLATAVKDGEMSPEEAFPMLQATTPPVAADESKSKADQLAAKLATKPAEEKKTEPETPKVEPVKAEGKSDADGNEGKLTVDDLADWESAKKILRDKAKDAGYPGKTDFEVMLSKILGLAPMNSTPQERFDLYQALVQGRVKREPSWHIEEGAK